MGETAASQHMKVADRHHPSVFIQDEMDERGWTRDELALRMGGDAAMNRLALDLYMTIGEDEQNLRLGRDMAVQLGCAFGTSAALWSNLETLWLGGL